jgi:hypothetical protein
MVVGRTSVLYEREIYNEIKIKTSRLDGTAMFIKLTARSNYCSLNQAVSVCLSVHIYEVITDAVDRLRLGYGFDGPGFGSRQGNINFLSPERSDRLWGTLTEYRGSWRRHNASGVQS